MTKLSIGTNGGTIPAVYPGTVQTLSVTGTSAAITNAVTSDIIRIVCTQDCFIVFGTAPTATTSDTFILANSVEYFRISPGEKVAAIRSTTSGTLYVTEAV